MQQAQEQPARSRIKTYLKPAVFALSLLPLLYIAWQVVRFQSGEQSLGADPGKAVVIFLGEWTINFLVLTLLVTPLRRLAGLNFLQPIRRMLGLYTFFYAALHFAGWLVLLLELRLGSIADDLVKRPFITVGFLALLLLLPLAVTSTNGMMRRLKRNWVRVHRLVYPIAVLAVIHLVWIAKSSYYTVAVYGGLLALLLLYRFPPLGRAANRLVNQANQRVFRRSP